VNATPRVLHPRLFLGTSAWSNRDWEGIVYPPGTPSRDYLSHYASRFRAVETDSTWYHTPSRNTTRRWAALLPEGFRMAAKVPRVITHEKLLVDCERELEEFLAAMEPLRDRIGPLLFQFPYFGRASGIDSSVFMKRFAGLSASLTKPFRFAVEVRNKGWIDAALLDLLARREVALTLIDHPWMPPIERTMESIDPVITDFVYIRWLGDRHGIEKVTRTWDRLVVDRQRETRAWAGAIRNLLERDVTVYGFFNNHYAGHAPGSIALFESIWDAISEE